ncbi:MAG: hypothetical protein ACRC92_21450 [Peptostreptococcaceae bacterium]
MIHEIFEVYGIQHSMSKEVLDKILSTFKIKSNDDKLFIREFRRYKI